MYKELGYTINEYNGMLQDIEKIPKKDRTINADKIVAGQLVLVNGLEDIPYSMDDIPWNIHHHALADSVQINLQGLLPIQYLCIGYLEKKETSYLQCAVEIFKSWFLYESNKDLTKDNAYVWNDHSVASRSKALISLLLLCEDNSFELNEVKEMLITTLERHAIWLMDDRNYFANCNHGIMQDQALIYIAQLINNQDKYHWLAHAKERLWKQIEFAFTTESVHVENSPHYHEMVLKLLQVISEFLGRFSDSDGKRLEEKVNASSYFLCWMIKPWGGLADIGDSDGYKEIKPFVNKRMINIKNPYLTYAATLGESGIKPEHNCMFYKDSGYFISRSTWEKDDIVNGTWFMFKAGYKSRVHKHADDLSFMLTSKGYDIFIDTGKYGYKIGDPRVDYLHSALGHNSVVVDNKSYSISNERTNLVGLSKYQNIGENGYFVEGYNHSYAGVSITRGTYLFDDLLIIHDSITSKIEHLYSQLYHLPSYIEIITKSEKEIIGRIAESGWIVRIQQMEKIDSLKVYTGESESKLFGYYSTKINEISDCHTIKFNQNGRYCEFITVISLEYKADVARFPAKYEEGKIILKDREIQLINIKPYSIDNIHCNMQNNELIIEDLNSFPANQYTYEIWNGEFKKKIAEYSTSDNHINIELCNKSDFVLKAIATTNENEELEKVIQIVKYDKLNECYTLLPIDEESSELVVNYQSMEWITNNTVRYTIHLNYNWDVKVNWLLYKDGGVLKTHYGVNCVKFECSFSKEGKYAMMYFISGWDDKKQFYSFPEVEYKFS